VTIILLKSSALQRGARGADLDILQQTKWRGLLRSCASPYASDHDLRDNEGGTPSLDGRPARAVDAVRVAWERFPSPAGRVRLCQPQCLV